VCLAITAGAGQGETFELERPRAVIGRVGGSTKVDIEIPDPEISSVHAAVECHGPTFVLRDLGSTNGTFLGEERIRDERPIENHTEFRVGRTHFMLIVSDRD
jgi:pSer/pThr/pTyr-binding forkhead associated (FHA) protein